MWYVYGNVVEIGEGWKCFVLFDGVYMVGCVVVFGWIGKDL